MWSHDSEYNNLLKNILAEGKPHSDRTGVGTLSLFGQTLRFDLNEGFPVLTTKKLAWKAVVGELLWFLEGNTDERRLAELTYGKTRSELVNKTTIWTANANDQGVKLGYQNDDLYKELGPVYGYQWRHFDSKEDQIRNLLHNLKTNPDSRRIVLSSWNPNHTKAMALPPCHLMAIFRVYDNKLSCSMTQRSADSFLGIPFNIASYALLTHLLARECGFGVGELVLHLVDAHIYTNHLEQVKTQLSRVPYNSPTLRIDDSFDLTECLDSSFNLNASSLITLENYQHHPAIFAPMAV